MVLLFLLFTRIKTQPHSLHTITWAELPILLASCIVDADPPLDLPISDAVHQDRGTSQSHHTTLNTTVPWGSVQPKRLLGQAVPFQQLHCCCFHRVVPTKTHYLLSQDEHFHSNKHARQVFGVRNYCELHHRLSNSEQCCKYHCWLYFSHDCV